MQCVYFSREQDLRVLTHRTGIANNRCSQACSAAAFARGVDTDRCHLEMVIDSLSFCVIILHTFSTNFKNWLFAVPGSPSKRILMSPRNRTPSGSNWNFRSLAKAHGHGKLSVPCVNLQTADMQ